MALVKRYECDLSGVSAAGVIAATEDGEEVEVPPAGWLEVTVRRVLPNADGLAAVAQRDAMRQRAIEEAVANTPGLTEEQAEAAVDQMFPAIEVPEFIVQDYDLHVSAKYSAQVITLFALDEDADVASQE